MMKQVLRYIVEIVAVVMPFVKKKETKEIREFSELITGQYEFLVMQLDKALKDYFEISAKVREMHTEMFNLKEQLARAEAERCRIRECKERV